ncbi:hypothetical protein [Actinoallomurus rhizosphaericola]|uniref:hypothetical protein n=1 Tax=Actinoallomurus rhizosphaericola TaxID=2952536 RepID=UPI0020914C34|nr:hypothetical protein [Actinoallomurus rhizosphaericola]MCO5992107.1 hypothetical protein [Actinoallomurus rhizosphaericola]
MRGAKKPAVVLAALAFAGAMAFAGGTAGAPSPTTVSHDVAAGHGGDGCDNWGDCWDTWGSGGALW